MHMLSLSVASLLSAQDFSPDLPASRAEEPQQNWLDIDANGNLDLALLTPYGRLVLLLSDGQGGFEDASHRMGLASLPPVVMALWSDYDMDGRPDLLVGDMQGARLLRNAEGAFIDTTMASGLDVQGRVHFAQWVMLDEDARPDLLVCSRSLDVYRGLEGGFFERIGQRLWDADRSTFFANDAEIRPGSVFSTEQPDAAQPGTPRLTRGSVLSGTGVHARTVTMPATSIPRISVPTNCAISVRDQAVPGTCLSASSVPTLGALFPLSSQLFVAPDGKIGMGTTTPVGNLELNQAGGVPLLRMLSGSNRNSYLSLVENNPILSGFNLFYQGQDNYLGIASRSGADPTALGTVRFAVNFSNGFVGIGASALAPAKLTLAGSSTSLWVTGSDSGDLVFPTATPASDKTGLRVFNDGASGGRPSLQGWNYNTSAPLDLTINAAGGRLGVGTNSPGTTLDVAGAVRATGLVLPTGAGASKVLTSDAAGNATWQNASGGLTGGGTTGNLPKFTGTGILGNSIVSESVAGEVFFGPPATPTMVVNSAGHNVGIGTPNPDLNYYLEINGPAKCTRLDQTSAREFKDDIHTLDGALETVLELRGVSYAWNERAPGNMTGKRDIGFIADEVQAVVPEVVGLDSTGKAAGLDYGKITPLLVEAIRDLKAENDELRQRLTRLEMSLLPPAEKNTQENEE